MSLPKLLSTLGHDANTFFGWIAKAAPAVGSVIEVVEPEWTPIISIVERGIADLAAVGKTPATADLQAITQAATTTTAVAKATGKTTPAIAVPTAPASASADMSTLLSDVAKALALGVAALSAISPLLAPVAPVAPTALPVVVVTN